MIHHISGIVICFLGVYVSYYYIHHQKYHLNIVDSTSSAHLLLVMREHYLRQLGDFHQLLATFSKVLFLESPTSDFANSNPLSNEFCFRGFFFVFNAIIVAALILVVSKI